MEASSKEVIDTYKSNASALAGVAQDQTQIIQELDQIEKELDQIISTGGNKHFLEYFKGQSADD